jgi:hypothetical protein
MEDAETRVPALGPVMATVPDARAWQQEQRAATEAFQAATNGHRGVPPPIDSKSFQAAPRPVDTHGYQPVARPNTAAVIDEFPAAAPTRALAPAAVSAGVPDDVIWLILRIVAIVLVLIALVLVARSV